jgi:DNA-binding response OmpR family regulator
MQMREGFSILLVEDDDSVRRAFERGFRIAGYRVDVATTIQEGLEKLNGHQIALLDLQLPDGHGTELLLKIRREGRPTRVAIYSGLAEAEAIVQACGELPDAFFRKPVELSQLLEWIGDSGGTASKASQVE